MSTKSVCATIMALPNIMEIVLQLSVFILFQPLRLFMPTERLTLAAAAEEVVAEEFLQELTSVIRVMEKVSAQYAMVRAGAVHTNVGLAKVQVDASSVTGEDTFTRITVEAVHLAVHLLVVAHRAAVRQEAAIVRRERVPFVEVPANVCPPVTIVSIVTALAHVRLVVEEVIIGLQVMR